MNYTKTDLKKFLVVCAMVAALSLTVLSAFNGNRVQVVNSSAKKINKIQASADGASFVTFTLPTGLKPGQTVDFNFNGAQQTCEWFLKATYADRSESHSTRFNLCEKDAVV